MPRGEENIDGCSSAASRSWSTSRSGCPAWQVRIDTNDSLLFASEADVDRMVEPSPAREEARAGAQRGAGRRVNKPP